MIQQQQQQAADDGGGGGEDDEDMVETTAPTEASSSSSSTTTSGRLNPPWRDIFEIPITVNTQEEFDSIPVLKRIAIVSRVSVLHLTLLSCLGPLIVRGSVRASLPLAARRAVAPVTPWLALLFTVDGLSWHVCHNLLNDYQDLDDDDAGTDSFRFAYGCHALKQGFLNRRQFFRLMAVVSIPGLVLTGAFYNTRLAPAAVYGIIALFFYTILFKPLALGEIVIYLVWGPLMAGYGMLAAGAEPWTSLRQVLLHPAVSLFGWAGFALIMGKHTDKIERSEKRTLPKRLGFPASLYACAATLIAPHVLLLTTLIREHFLNRGGGIVPTLPVGSALAFMTLFRELPASLRALRLGPPKDKDTPPMPFDTVIRGTIIDAVVERAWPLWFVAFCGWHAITFSYLLVAGSGLEWGLRALLGL